MTMTATWHTLSGAKNHFTGTSIPLDLELTRSVATRTFGRPRNKSLFSRTSVVQHRDHEGKLVELHSGCGRVGNHPLHKLGRGTTRGATCGQTGRLYAVISRV